MSAQIIAALRRRADALDRKAEIAERCDDRLSVTVHMPFYALLAAEFRELADEAEGQEVLM